MFSFMDSSSLTMVLILCLLVSLSAFFSATETAMSSLNRMRLKSKAEGGNTRAIATLKLVDDYDRLLSCILIANNIVNLTAASLGTVLFTRFYQDYGATLSTVVLTVVILIFGEITPKSLAKAHAEGFAMFTAPIMRVVIFLLTPLNVFFSLFCKLANHLVGDSTADGITEEELITMVAEAESEGGLDAHESQLIRAAIEFNDLEVKEILIPRVDITAVEQSASMADMAAAFAESGYSRLPIYQGDIDNIIGIVHEKDFYIACHHQAQDFSGCIAPVHYTAGNTKISALLRILQRSKAHMAVVVDEYGGTQGLLTLEDILEELVGEIWDEHDEILEEFQLQDDGSYCIACTADLDDFLDRFSLDAPEGDVSSIGGWVLQQFHAIPKEGDCFTHQTIQVTVTRLDNRRIGEIQVRLVPQEVL